MPFRSFRSSPPPTPPFQGMTTSRLPGWLKKVTNDNKHRAYLLQELAFRESLRASYRAATHSSQSNDLHSPGADQKSSPDNEYSDTSSSRNNLELEEFYSTRNATVPRHRKLNRYADIHPYDRGNVAVQGSYLNGSWVKERFGNAWWIATQAPLPRTMYTFWSLCTSLTPENQRVRTIVQLTADNERGIRKGDPYYPTEVGPAGTIEFVHPQSSALVGDPHNQGGPSIEVTMEERKEIADAECIQSTLRITLVHSSRSDKTTEPIRESFRVQHFYYIAWPDHGVPQDTTATIQLVHMVDTANRAASSGNASTPPILAHCSAGVGRTGTFIAISSLFRAMGILPPPLNVANPPTSSPIAASPLGEIGELLQDDMVVQEVDSLREQRPWMLQRPEQILFAYLVLARVLSER